MGKRESTEPTGAPHKKQAVSTEQEPTADAEQASPQTQTQGVAVKREELDTKTEVAAGTASDNAEASALPTPALPTNLRDGLVNAQAQNSEEIRAKRRASLMRFNRSKEPTTGKRKSRTEKIPPEIMEKISGDQQSNMYYFELWAASNESWGKVLLYEKRSQRQTDSKQLKQMWVTEGQLKKYYQDNDLVAAIIKGKTADMIREHPEAKGFNQFLCILDESIVNTQEHVHETGVAFQGEVDKAGGGSKVVPQLVNSMQTKAAALAATSTSTATPPPMAQEEIAAEKERKKEEQKRKLDEKKNAQRANATLRAQSWLLAIGKPHKNQ